MALEKLFIVFSFGVSSSDERRCRVKFSEKVLTLGHQVLESCSNSLIRTKRGPSYSKSPAAMNKMYDHQNTMEILSGIHGVKASTLLVKFIKVPPTYVRGKLGRFEREILKGLMRKHGIQFDEKNLVRENFFAEEKTLDRSPQTEAMISNEEEIQLKKTNDYRAGINSLPDSILHHVLSFLNMKEAIGTCLVSKRWRYLWDSIPTLNFTRCKKKEKAFMEFVDTVFILHDNICNIQRFSITDVKTNDYSCSSSSSKSDSDSDTNLRLNIWIRSTIRRNLEEIHLEIYFGKSVKLPNCLFTCTSLRKLKLISLDSLQPKLILPAADSMITLPQLESLHLDGLTLHHEDDFKINHFLLNCCNGLKSLTINKCEIHRKNLNIVASNLMHLVINEEKDFSQYGGATGSVRLYAPNLISFHCKDYLSKTYYLENVSSLVEAYIDMIVTTTEKREARVQEKGRNVMIHGKKIDFGILHNVKHLWLSTWALQIFIATYGSSHSASTEFHNLRSLELETRLSEDCIRGITCLLHFSPNIVKLSLKIIDDTVTPVFPRWDEIKLNPADIGDYLKLPLQCMLDHLKIVEIRGLKGTVNELKFLEILLKNAVVLEELIMAFSCYYLEVRHREKRLIKYSKILQSFPRASSSVSIFFISS